MIELFLVAAFLAPAVLLAKLLHLAATRRITLSARPAGKWAEGAVLGVCAALPLQAYTLVLGFGRSISETCVQYGGRSEQQYTGVEEAVFPRSLTCLWRDGTTTELVPLWLNSLILACLAGAAVCAVLAVRAAVLQRKETERHD